MNQRLTTAIRLTGAALVCAVLALQGVPISGQAGTVMPVPRMQWFDDNGDPCDGCKLYTYAAGTSTPLATYTTSTLVTPNANPVVADAAGRMTVYLSSTSYNFILKTSAGVTIWTQDNVASAGLTATGIGFEAVTMAGDPTSPVTVTSYPSGTTFSTCHAGVIWYSIDSANLPPGTYALEGMLLASAGTVTAALVNLSDGSPDTAIVTIASTSTTGARVQSSAITFAASGAAKLYSVKVKVSAGYGLAWGLRIVRIA